MNILIPTIVEVALAFGLVAIVVMAHVSGSGFNRRKMECR